MSNFRQVVLVLVAAGGRWTGVALVAGVAPVLLVTVGKLVSSAASAAAGHRLGRYPYTLNTTTRKHARGSKATHEKRHPS